MNEIFFKACKTGNIATVEYLIKKVNIETKTDGAVLASLNGHLEVVKYLVEKGADFRVATDFAVRWASQNGHLEVVKYLVGMGADFRAGDNYAVKMACSYRHFKVVKYLVEMGAPEDLISDEARDYIRRSKMKWSRANHSDFSKSTNKLFGSLFLGIQRLEETGVVPLAHQAMLEDILEGLSAEDI